MSEESEDQEIEDILIGGIKFICGLSAFCAAVKDEGEIDVVEQ